MNPNPHPIEADLEDLRRGFGPVYLVEPDAPAGERFEPIPAPGDEMHVPPLTADQRAAIDGMRNAYPDCLLRIQYDDARNTDIRDRIDYGLASSQATGIARVGARKATTPRIPRIPHGCDQQGRHPRQTIYDELPAVWRVRDWFVIFGVLCLLALCIIGWPA